MTATQKWHDMKRLNRSSNLIAYEDFALTRHMHCGVRMSQSSVAPKVDRVHSKAVPLAKHGFVNLAVIANHPMKAIAGLRNFPASLPQPVPLFLVTGQLKHTVCQ